MAPGTAPSGARASDLHPSRTTNSLAGPRRRSGSKAKPEAWKACRENPRKPAEAIEEYAGWLESLPGRPVFVGYPAAYDFLFVYWYLIRFARRSPFSFSALDIKTLAMTLLGTEYHATTKKAFPRRWFGEAHRHVALADAIEQGQLFCNLLAEARARLAGEAPPPTRR